MLVLLAIILAVAALALLRYWLEARKMNTTLNIPLFEVASSMRLSTPTAPCNQNQVFSPVRLTTWKPQAFDAWQSPDTYVPFQFDRTRIPSIPSGLNYDDQMFCVDLATPNARVNRAFVEEPMFIDEVVPHFSTGSRQVLPLTLRPWESPATMSISSSLFDRSSIRNSGRTSHNSEYSQPLPTGQNTFSSPLSFAGPFDEEIEIEEGIVFGDREVLV